MKNREKADIKKTAVITAAISAVIILAAVLIMNFISTSAGNAAHGYGQVKGELFTYGCPAQKPGSGVVCGYPYANSSITFTNTKNMQNIYTVVTNSTGFYDITLPQVHIS